MEPVSTELNSIRNILRAVRFDGPALTRGLAGRDNKKKKRRNEYLSSRMIKITVAGMVTLQNLQNLANLQNLPQVASLAAGLQGMTAGLSNNQLINTPLNLTVSSSGIDKRSTISIIKRSK